MGRYSFIEFEQIRGPKVTEKKTNKGKQLVNKFKQKIKGNNTAELIIKTHAHFSV